MEELKIVGWVSYDSPYPTINLTQENINYIFGLIIDEIVTNKYFFSGEEHQNAETGVPLFSNGTCFRSTMRAFGEIMASIYNQIEKKNYSYMDFYMSLNNSKLPLENEVFVEISNAESAIGFYDDQDVQLLNEVLSFDMPFMTTDKELKKIYEIVKNNMNNENIDE